MGVRNVGGSAASDDQARVVVGRYLCRRQALPVVGIHTRAGLHHHRHSTSVLPHYTYTDRCYKARGRKEWCRKRLAAYDESAIKAYLLVTARRRAADGCPGLVGAGAVQEVWASAASTALPPGQG